MRLRILVQDPVPLIQLGSGQSSGDATSSYQAFLGVFFEGSRAASPSFRYACSRKKALTTKHLTEHQTKYRTSLVSSSPRARQVHLAEGLQYSLLRLATHLNLLIKLLTKTDYSYEFIRIAKGSRLSRWR